jgi:hypothetical protein
MWLDPFHELTLNEEATLDAIWAEDEYRDRE